VKVVVVGGGIIGCASALELAKAGARVVLCERAMPGAEASSAAAGMLAALGGGPRTQFQNLAIASWRLYPEVAAELRERSGIDVELVRRGTLYPAFAAAAFDSSGPALSAELAAEFGVQMLDAGETRKREPALAPDVCGALFVEGDHWVNNQRLVTAYAQSAVTAGIMLRVGAAVSRVLVSAGRARGVIADGEEIGADAVLLAAGAWTGEVAASLGARLPIAPSRGQMLALAHVPPVLTHCVHGEEAYLVPRPSGELLVGATVERVGFRREVTAKGIGSLIAEAVQLVPALGDRAITRTWCGFRPWAPDSLPILGPWPGIAGLFVATAHYRNGIVLAPITARLMTEWILKGDPSIAVSDFLPDRFINRPAPRS
jgi:glycine oxidase